MFDGLEIFTQILTNVSLAMYLFSTKTTDFLGVVLCFNTWRVRFDLSSYMSSSLVFLPLLIPHTITPPLDRYKSHSGQLISHHTVVGPTLKSYHARPNDSGFFNDNVLIRFSAANKNVFFKKHLHLYAYVLMQEHRSFSHCLSNTRCDTACMQTHATHSVIT